MTPPLYGQDLHVLTFSEAVNRGLLVDYKVIILAMDEAHVSRRLQDLLKDENNSLRVDDAAKFNTHKRDSLFVSKLQRRRRNATETFR